MAEVKTANPAPLGLAGFAATTFVLSFANSGFFPNSKDEAVVLGLALFYGGIAQLLAGMWAFRNGNTFQGTAFSSYGAFWLSFAALALPGLGGAAALSSTAVGIYLLAWAIFTGIMLLGSLRTTGATVLVFLLLFVTFLLLSLGALQGSSNLHQLGGYVGIATAIAAWYDALAGVMSSVSNGKISLPTIPLNG